MDEITEGMERQRKAALMRHETERSNLKEAQYHTRVRETNEHFDKLIASWQAHLAKSIEENP